MAIARKDQVNLEVTPYYHCVNRCVRRSFLWGTDSYSGRDYSHRKPWVKARLAELAAVFAVEVCAYAVMSTHLHLVLRVAKDISARWSDREVMRRVGKLFPGVARRYKTALSAKEQTELVSLWRERLSDLSWFMRCVSEYIARRCNAEDGCKGRFWEGRFRSQALLDDRAVLAAMSYVDLNPIRAGLANSLDTSDWTSIRQRLYEFAGQKDAQKNTPKDTPAGETRPAIDHMAATGDSAATPTAPVGTVMRREGPMDPVSPDMHQTADLSHADLSSDPLLRVPLKPLMQNSQGPTVATCAADVGAAVESLNLSLADYVALVTYAGCQYNPSKRGRLTQPQSEFLERLGLSPEQWCKGVSGFGETGLLVGAPDTIAAQAKRFGRQRRANRARALSSLYGQTAA